MNKFNILDDGLIINRISKTYGNKQVIRNISLSIKRGEIVGLLGPNGAGKTTSFYIIVGLVKPDRGNIFLDKIEVSDRVSHPQAALCFNIICPIENLKLNSCTVGKSSWTWKSKKEPRIEDNFYSPHYDKIVDSKRLVIPMDSNEHDLTIHLSK